MYTELTQNNESKLVEGGLKLENCSKLLVLLSEHYKFFIIDLKSSLIFPFPVFFFHSKLDHILCLQEAFLINTAFHIGFLFYSFTSGWLCPQLNCIPIFLAIVIIIQLFQIKYSLPKELFLLHPG